MSLSSGQRLRKLFSSGTAIQLPGAFNGLCGRIAADTGFEALYISGGAISAAHGVPDIGLLSVEHFASKIREVSVVSGLPIIADADTGFGEAEMVTRTVHEYIQAGAGGLHIEDQAFPKRCGHLDGKELISIDHMTEKIRRARAAADSVDPDFIVCARTDARSVNGFDEAVHRAAEYVKAGADMIFPEGLVDIGEFAKFSSAMKGFGNNGPYLLANMTEFGKTEHILISDFEKLGIWSEDLKNEIILNEGSIQNINFNNYLDPEDKKYNQKVKRIEHLMKKYKTIWEISQRELIDMAADRGPFIDQSQSMNIYMGNPTLSKITSSHFHAWSKGLKTLCYYVRTKAISTGAKHLAMDISKKEKPKVTSLPPIEYTKSNDSPFECFGCTS
jgi:methylisocitrate lyase